jgi:hypothetical protein
VLAYDETYQGRVDLSKFVLVGDPIKKSSLRWSVPYNVKDAAGNAAKTVWRDVVVEEVDLSAVETKIREEFLEIQRAKDKASEEERKRRERNVVNSRERRTSASCPDCPNCDSTNKINEAACQAICDARIKSCAIDDESIVIQFLIWLERWFPPSMVPIVLICNAFVIVLLILRWILTLIFNPQAYQRRYYVDAERERALMNAVVYHHNVAGNGFTPSFVSPQSTNNSNGHFSPQGKNAIDTVPLSAPTGQNQLLRGEDFTDIYQSPIITPSKRGDGIRRRAPYSGSNRSSM